MPCPSRRRIASTQASSRDGRGVFEGLDRATRDAAEVVYAGEVGHLDRAATHLALQTVFTYIHTHVVFKGFPTCNQQCSRASGYFHGESENNGCGKARRGQPNKARRLNCRNDQACAAGPPARRHTKARRRSHPKKAPSFGPPSRSTSHVNALMATKQTVHEAYSD